MIYRRKYLQFNDLVIDNYDMLLSANHTADFKVDSEEYSFGHGSYSPIKGTFVKEQSVPLSITLYMNKLPCEYRPFYKQFAIKEITTPGKLWAIENNTLIWAYARITSISEDLDVNKDEYRIEADFLLWEGVWHKADKLKTFLIPYNVCDFMDCLNYKEINPCENVPLSGDCCTACINKVKAREESCECCCDSLTQDMALCYHDDLQIFYGSCTPSYQIAYSCQKAYDFFGEIGTKLCTKDSCSNLIAGTVYSDTEIPTSGYTIVIDGEVHNAQIRINGNMNVIKGDYERLEIHSNGDVYADGCDEPLDPSVWEVPQEYGWEFVQGNNHIVIDRGSCCMRACVYIQIDSLTI